MTETSEQEDEKKRSRGRPRLDTKDETAADRRRTQIRLAQRAYRNRKENTIQTLEKQVRQLKHVNEEMSNAFLQLHDFAVASGLLDKMPQFARCLRGTTEKFLTLARDGIDDDDRNARDPGASSGGHAPANGERNQDIDSGQLSGAGHSLAGLTAMGELGRQAEVAVDSPSNLIQPATAPYHDLTYPTHAGTNFSFQSGPELDQLSDIHFPSPWPLIPAPASYCAMETTFGRRLHRYALERGLILLDMPGVSQDNINRVFGFCLLVETIDGIKRRLHRMLGHGTRENLNYWLFPFFHLGGAGTHIDPSTTTAEGKRFGNQGTIDVDKPRVTAGFATGPFSADITSVRDQDLDEDMRMKTVPGFEGEYLDCDETEMYLYQRGVVIPPGADLVRVEVDPSDFNETAWELNPFLQPDGDALFEIVDRQGGGPSCSSSPPGLGSCATVTDVTSPNVTTCIPTDTSTTTAHSNTLPLQADPFAFTPPVQANNDTIAPVPPVTTTKRTVIIDVHILIKELSKRSICLGRTPGIKPSTINEAFWASVQTSV
ncbi:hypothetical protein VTK26DRAFT_3226 [Humicola hyalothermophila]